MLDVMVMKEIDCKKYEKKVDGVVEFVVIGDEVYFEDYERTSIDKIHLTRNTGRVTDVFLNRQKGDYFVSIKVSQSIGHSPREIGKTANLRFDLYLAKNPRRKIWKNEGERTETERRWMRESGFATITDDEVIWED